MKVCDELKRANGQNRITVGEEDEESEFVSHQPMKNLVILLIQQEQQQQQRYKPIRAKVTQTIGTKYDFEMMVKKHW